MIIFGTRGVTSTSGKGRFFCPGCDREQAYQTKRMRRFFTLYFIPLIPLDVLQEWVECGQCRQSYKPEVLRYDPAPRQAAQAAARATVVAAARRVLAMAAGPSPGPVVRAAAQQAHQVLFGEEWTAADLDEDLARAASPAATLEPVSRISDQMNTAGKEAILAHAVGVARAGGAVAPEIASALGAAAAAMGVSEAHWRGILASAPPTA
jgi:hypothetical protein